MEAWIDGRIVAVPYVEESLTLRSYFVDAARGVLLSVRTLKNTRIYEECFQQTLSSPSKNKREREFRRKEVDVFREIKCFS